MILSEKEFRRLSQFIYNEVGIKMPDAKRTMLTGRLQKRLRALKINSFREYCDFLFSDEGLKSELIHMIDVVTTNKTDFFREPAHFEYITHTVLPEMMRKQGYRSTKKVKIWSAGCSTGEEPYTLTMVLREFQERCGDPDFFFEILATDISTKVLSIAMRGIYHQDQIRPVPMALRKKYLLRSKDHDSDLVRVVAENRQLVKFARLNFMAEDFGFRDGVDVIFCRNVIIYFDKSTQERLIQKFCRHLNPGGYLFLGHSESLHGLNNPLVQTAPTVYRKPA